MVPEKRLDGNFEKDYDRAVIRVMHGVKLNEKKNIEEFMNIFGVE